jgi:hypothetical protein
MSPYESALALIDRITGRSVAERVDAVNKAVPREKNIPAKER